MGWSDALQISKENSAALCGYFEHPRRVQFDGCVAEPLQTFTEVEVELLLLRIVLQDSLCDMVKVYSLVKLKVCVDDIYSFLEVRNSCREGLEGDEI